MSHDLEALSGLTPLQRSVVALGALRARLDAIEAERREPIAIVGLGCRFPGADGPEEFWRLLVEGVDAVGELPPERWGAATDPDEPAHLRYGAFLRDVDRFDAAYFGITPREARTMDPQQRILLEVAVEALEDAALAPAPLEGSRTGIFVGAMTSDYAQIATAGAIDLHTVTGVGNCLLAGRLAHVLGTRGPTLTVDTACSSSLVAFHLACQSLRMRESDLAIAAGVNLILTPMISRVEDRARILSKASRCQAFDAAADGIVRGEGCGVVVLCRLGDAVARRGRVLAVVRGSAMAHDGRSAGLTVPSDDAQRVVIRAALEQARIDPVAVQYLEAHGAGTSLGDLIELSAVGGTLCVNRPVDRPLLIGSVKTNLGHLEAAAGMAGLIKTVLALRHATVPPNLHLRTPNPLVPWDELPVRVPVAATRWPSGPGPRTASVSSFGLSGTNAHVVLTEAPPAAPAAAIHPERPLHLLTLSARSADVLRALASRYAERLRDAPEMPIGDVCFTANSGRAQHVERLAVVAPDLRSLAERLASYAAAEEAVGLTRGRAELEQPAIALVLGGSMRVLAPTIRALARHAPLATAIEECDRALAAGSMPAVGELLLDPATIPTSAEPLAAVVSEIALARLWQSWGVRPALVLGRGAGAWTAAHLAGALPLDATLRLAWRYGEWYALGLAGAPEREIAVAWTALEEAAASAVPAGPVLPILTRRAGDGFDAMAATPAEWAALCLDTGPWDAARAALAARGCQLVLEPGSDGESEPWQRLLDQAARLYLAGVPIDWAAFDAGYDRRIVSLPTYPFDRQRYWVASAAAPTGSPRPGPGVPADAYARTAPSLESRLAFVERLSEHDAAAHLEAGLAARIARLGPTHRALLSALVEEDERVTTGPPPHPCAGSPDGAAAGVAEEAEPVEEACVHEVAWRRSRAPATAPVARPGSWLIIGDEDGIGARLRAELELAGRRALLVSETVALGEEGDDEVRSGPSLAAALARAGHTAADSLQGLVYLVRPQDGGAASTPDALRVAQERGALAALRLVQALDRSRAMPRRLCLVTRGSQAVRDDDRVSPAWTPFWAIGATIANEYPHVRVMRADLPATPDDGESASLLASSVLADDAETQIALRDGARYVPRLVRASPAAAGSRGVSFPLSPDASYLVTGGLGALGLATAGWLAERGARHVVLLARGTHMPSEVDALLEAGIAVTVHAADVGDPAAMRLLFDELARAHPPLRGIVHAAGVLDDGVLTQQSPERFARVFRPKVGGAWVLHELSRDLPLDFFVCFSSMAGVIGTPGQANYVAANAAMDAVARYRRSLGLPGTSVRWGPWAGRGMALAIGAHDPNRLRSIGVRPLAPAFGLRILESILRGGGQVAPVVVDANWVTFASHPSAAPLRAFLSELATPPASEPSPSGEFLLAWRAADGATGQAMLLAHVRETVARAMSLKPDAVDPAQPLLRLGLDSLMAVEVKRSLFTTLSIEIDLTAVLEGASVLDLAASIARMLTDAESAVKAAGPDRGPPAAMGEIPEQIDAGAARDLLQRLDLLSDSERDRLLERMLLET